MKLLWIDAHDRPVFGVELGDMESVLAAKHHVVVKFIPKCIPSERRELVSGTGSFNYIPKCRSSDLGAREGLQRAEKEPVYYEAEIIETQCQYGTLCDT